MEHIEEQMDQQIECAQSAYEELQDALIDFCKELIAIEDREWKPMQCFRSDEQVARDEARHEMASEIADKARELMAKFVGPNASFSGGPSGPSAASDS